MPSPKITHELPVPPIAAPPLYHTLFRPNAVELGLLKALISPDEDELKRKLFEVQEIAYRDYPYPCIRQFHFVSLFMRDNVVYPEVVERGKKGDAYFLDLGCMMGTDVRNLMRDGYPGDHIIACDLRDNYIKLGFSLYRDEHTTPITFITGDMFDIVPKPASASPPPLTGRVRGLNELWSQLTHIYTGALFHLFDEETQKAIALRLAGLWKREPGGVIFGRHSGAKEEGLIDDPMGRLRYAHSPKSWERMWKEVMEEMEGEGAGEKIKVQAVIKGPPEDAKRVNFMLYWSVQRV